MRNNDQSKNSNGQSLTGLHPLPPTLESWSLLKEGVLGENDVGFRPIPGASWLCHLLTMPLPNCVALASPFSSGSQLPLIKWQFLMMPASLGAEDTDVLMDVKTFCKLAGGMWVCVAAVGRGRSDLESLCFALQRAALGCAMGTADAPWT